MPIPHRLSPSQSLTRHGRNILARWFCPHISVRFQKRFCRFLHAILRGWHRRLPSLPSSHERIRRWWYRPCVWQIRMPILLWFVPLTRTHAILRCWTSDPSSTWYRLVLRLRWWFPNRIALICPHRPDLCRQPLICRSKWENPLATYHKGWFAHPLSRIWLPPRKKIPTRLHDDHRLLPPKL